MSLSSHACSTPPRRRPRVRPVLHLDRLEPRPLLSGITPFASFSGLISGSSADAFTLKVSPDDFQFAGGRRVILRFDARAGDDGTLDPGALNLDGPPTGLSWILTRRADVPGGTGSVTLASVGNGSTTTFRPTAQGGTEGAYEVDVSLAGDTDGNGRVDLEDIRAIRGALGRRGDDSGVAPGADVNGDGWVGLLDLLVAARNFGAATDLQPLKVTLEVDPADDPDGDDRVDADVEAVDVVGRVAPGATVRLDLGDDGSFDETATADAQGNYRFTVPLSVGVNRLAVQTADSFGQVAETRLSITRGAAAEAISVSDDFTQGDQGWEAGFADLPEDPGATYELDSGLRPLPDELGVDGTGYLLQSHNRSDDVFMFLKKHLGAEDGIVANQAYEVRFTITFASDAPSGGVGIGGAPGESVYLKAGAGPVEPRAVPQSDGTVRMNVDKGNQAIGGPAASVAGNIANGQEPVSPGPQPYVSVTREHTHTLPARADAEGNLWLLVGTDSGCWKAMSNQ